MATGDSVPRRIGCRRKPGSMALLLKPLRDKSPIGGFTSESRVESASGGEDSRLGRWPRRYELPAMDLLFFLYLRRVSM